MSQVDEARIAALHAALTTDEKIALLAGSSMWRTTPVERLGIPAMKVTDGPNGARGGSFAGGAVTAACFPAGIALGASWDVALVHAVGAALADEARSKGASMLLAPTVNIHRTPLNGRNFECYAEDPYLSARLAVAAITGLQAGGVGATVKHFVCNDSEYQRNSISSDVDERTLREIYLPPFEAAVTEARTWGVMSAYNRINGTFAAEHHEFLTAILRDEWEFDGIVMSDWFGTTSVAAGVNAGLDLEMPGPPAWRGARLAAAVAAGEVLPAALDAAALRMLRVLARAGLLDGGVPSSDERAEDRPEHRALIRRAGAAGAVLLKNRDAILPLDATRLQTIAVIGPNARLPRMMGGGSAQVAAHHAVVPYEALLAAVGDAVELRYAPGCSNDKVLPLPPRAMLRAAGGAAGFDVAYFAADEPTGTPVHHERATAAERVWLGDMPPGLERGRFSARFTTTLTPTESGVHRFSLVSAGLSRMWLDDVLLVDNWSHQMRGDAWFGFGSREVQAEAALDAGRPVALRVEYSSRDATMFAAVRLGYAAPMPADAIAQAAALAAGADVALVYVGMTGDWESEGFDRPDMELPGAQNALVAAVAAANPHTVVVLQTGSPVTMPWLDQVAAVLQAWYPGQEVGDAITDVLLGRADPGGRLPQTFPRRLEDHPGFINYPGEHGHVRYGEGIFVGYRYYEKKRVAPLFPFGFGLSYTTFEYGELMCSAHAVGPDDTLDVTLSIRNTGTRRGSDVVQLYVGDLQAGVARPGKELRGFVKVTLDPGASQTVRLTLGRRDWAFWDASLHAWHAEAGEFDILVGPSSADIRRRARVRLEASQTFGGPPRHHAPTLSLASPLTALLARPAARAIIETYLPGMAMGVDLGMVGGFSLEQIARFAPDRVPEAVLPTIAAELAMLGHAG